ncbi:glycosyltransferase family 4 protein [Sphingomonas bacterium]|uniref:glycosyltransferase family 4 protein n=1 Tax=Sphingomonas bacterium TaxID=1895847 RepID=UPI001575DA94|nr:glycosyltransferase family 4 protein [Sphingomonas bacterium]
MRIAVVAHLRYPIAPPFMGGMEAHSHLLTRALVARGHDVTLFAAGDSDATLPLRALTPRHHETTLPWALWMNSAELSQIQDDAFETAAMMIERDGFDVVHNNTMHPTLLNWAARVGQPMVTSLHIPPFGGLADAVARNAVPWLRETTTSHAHLASWWSVPPGSATVVYNGIDLAAWPFVPQGNGRAVWCGRVTPNKGTAVAIEAAKTLGIPLDVVGPIDCMDYFDAEVAPRLDADRIYRGLLHGPELASMLGAASVLVSTPMWDEPFGLVNVEAMACGVPVAAIDRGAMREVIGDCGVLAQDANALPGAIDAAMGLSRRACRQRVERVFSVDAMLDGYEAAYAAAIAARPVSSRNTVAALA